MEKQHVDLLTVTRELEQEVRNLFKLLGNKKPDYKAILDNLVRIKLKASNAQTGFHWTETQPVEEDDSEKKVWKDLTNVSRRAILEDVEHD